MAEIKNLAQLKMNIDQLCECLSQAGFSDLTKIPLNFSCNDRSEGTVVESEQIDSMKFDFLADKKKLEIELS